VKFWPITQTQNYGSVQSVGEAILTKIRSEGMQKFISRDLFILALIVVWKRILVLL